MPPTPPGPRSPTLRFTAKLDADGELIVHEFLDEQAATDFAQRAKGWLLDVPRRIFVDPRCREFADRLADLVIASLMRREHGGR